MIILVTFIVVYRQDTQIMLQILQNIRINNIIFKIDLFILVVFKVKTGRGLKSYNNQLYSEGNKKNPTYKENSPPNIQKMWLLLTRKLNHLYKTFNIIWKMLPEKEIWKTQIKRRPFKKINCQGQRFNCYKTVKVLIKKKRKIHQSYSTIW